MNRKSTIKSSAKPKKVMKPKGGALLGGKSMKPKKSIKPKKSMKPKGGVSVGGCEENMLCVKCNHHYLEPHVVDNNEDYSSSDNDEEHIIIEGQGLHHAEDKYGKYFSFGKHGKRHYYTTDRGSIIARNKAIKSGYEFYN